MKSKNKIHIKINILDIVIKDVSEIELYKVFDKQQRNDTAVTPEVIIAVIAGSSLVVRQFIYSLFDYLKTKKNDVIIIKFFKDEEKIKIEDIDNKEKITKLIERFKKEENEISIFNLGISS